MAKKLDDDFDLESDEEEEENEEIEAEEIERPRNKFKSGKDEAGESRGRGRPPIIHGSPYVRQSRDQRTDFEKGKHYEGKYQAYHITERAGIIDSQSNQSIGDDVLTILAKVLNKLEIIEQAVC